MDLNTCIRCGGLCRTYTNNSNDAVRVVCIDECGAATYTAYAPSSFRQGVLAHFERSSPDIEKAAETYKKVDEAYKEAALSQNTPREGAFAKAVTTVVEAQKPMLCGDEDESERVCDRCVERGVETGLVPINVGRAVHDFRKCQEYGKAVRFEYKNSMGERSTRVAYIREIRPAFTGHWYFAATSDLDGTNVRQFRFDRVLAYNMEH